MKKTVLVFGLLSGAVSSVMMLATVPFMDRIGFDNGGYVGYTAIILSFLLVYFGIRSHRDNVNGGRITFGQALLIGMLITVISCVFYVATWEVIYFNFTPDFLDKYADYVIQKAKAAGATEQALAQQAKQMAEFKVMYQNPLINVAMTFVEPFPVGVIITLISALALRKK